MGVRKIILALKGLLQVGQERTASASPASAMFERQLFRNSGSSGCGKRGQSTHARLYLNTQFGRLLFRPPVGYVITQVQNYSYLRQQIHLLLTNTMNPWLVPSS